MKMITIGIWICLITLASQFVHSKVITINSISGDTSHKCCTKEGCICGSLSTALQYITSNTVINITSKSVTLNSITRMGRGKLTNIKITGSNVTIMCNNSGSVCCKSCDHVTIEGITWDRCGDPDEIDSAGVKFLDASNILLMNCTFQHSQILAVALHVKSGDINVNYCNFLSNKRKLASNIQCGVLYITPSSISSTIVDYNIKLSNSYFYDNGFNCGGSTGQLNVFDDSNTNIWHVTITKTKFYSNMFAATYINVGSNSSIQLIELVVDHNKAYCSTAGIDLILLGNSNLLVSNSLFSNNIGCAFLWVTNSMHQQILISNSNFTSNSQLKTKCNNDNYEFATVVLYPATIGLVEITLINVKISHSISVSNPNGGSLFIHFSHYDHHKYNSNINLTRVNLISNTYLGDAGGAVYIYYAPDDGENNLTFEDCNFFNNTSSRGAALYVDDNSNSGTNIMILNSKINDNNASSIMYINSDGVISTMTVTIKSSNFTNNTGSCINLFKSKLLCKSTVFANNTADSGAALYIDQGSSLEIDDGVTVQFINNSAAEHGGAIYINLDYDCSKININCDVLNSKVDFVNNVAEISGNSLYFYVPMHCKVKRNINDPSSFMHIPCQFNYYQLVNGKMMDISCYNTSKSPIATSPHELRLYFPYTEGFNISNTSENNVYFMKNNILGHPVKFTSAMFDYFGNSAELTQFNVQCMDCLSFVLPRTHFLVDNITSLSVVFSGPFTEKRINVTLMLTSVIHSIKEISATLVVELLPCISHPGYTYSIANETCICYHYNVDCHDNYNEIKRGYWFGSVKNITTTALCPRYCRFIGHKETRQGYFELPNTIDAQCNHHRVGMACGQCSSGYTLSYDSDDCISVDRCGAGWTVLVIVSTCLYWIVIVAGVFGLMYFKFQISSGYLYGIIYYYSIVGILLNNNPYISDEVFQFVSVLSSFAQISPQFLGTLCFVKGLSGIDQLFIHYSHAVGVSLLLLLIVVAARCSARISLFVSRCIIRVICLLILLSYTSIASTSLQLLRPLRFTDVKQVYTYSSPDMEYFHGRHIGYGIVAAICELVIVIGLPLLLLLEPILSRKINFIKIKPILDHFQGCYKDKYRWFAAYYLICRQVLFLIVYTFNSNYYNMLFYLQTACVIIAMVHMWFQPYHNELLNAVDGVMLLLMVLVVNINTVSFLTDLTVEIISVILVVFPLIMFSMIIFKKVIFSRSYTRNIHHQHSYNVINNVDNNDQGEENMIRNVHELDDQSYNTFQESLLEFSLNNDNQL